MSEVCVSVASIEIWLITNHGSIKAHKTGKIAVAKYTLKHFTTQIRQSFMYVYDETIKLRYKRIH